MNSEFSDFRSFYINHVKPRCNYPPETEPYKTKLANGLAITVRREHPDDYAAVENLTRRAFFNAEKLARDGIPCDEHLLVRKLRAAPEFIPELDLVAECELLGQRHIVGNVMFTAAYVKTPSGEFIPALVFGPLSVLPEYQRMGIGKALLSRAEEIARSAGWGAIFLYGHPWYYPRLGYKEAKEFAVTTHDGKNFPAFMAKELVLGYLSAAAGGKYYYSPVYELDMGEAREFDGAFPPVVDGPQARPLHPSHLPYIHRLMNLPEILEVMHERQTDLPVWSSAYQNWTNRGERAFAIYSGEQPAGWLRLGGFDGDAGTINVLVIDPRYARRGLGRFAVGFAEGVFRERGLRRIEIYAAEDNIPARALYESCGFRIAGRGECTTGDGTACMGITFEKVI